MGTTIKNYWKKFDTFMSEHGFRIVNALLIVLGIIQHSVINILHIVSIWIMQELFFYIIKLRVRIEILYSSTLLY